MRASAMRPGIPAGLVIVGIHDDSVESIEQMDRAFGPINILNPEDIARLRAMGIPAGR